MLITAVTKPLFLKEEFEAEFGNVREELTARSNNHFRHLSLALRQSYGFAMKTDQDRLKLMANVELKDIREHYELTHTTSNMRFVIAGHLPIERRKLIKKAFDSIELPLGDGRFELTDERPISLEKPLYINNKTIENIYVYVDTFMSRRIRDPEVDALSLINTMLTETLYSRIFGAAREKGLIYGMSSGMEQTKDISGWWIGAQIMPKNAPALFDIIVRELTAVFKGKIKDEDITAAKQYAIGRYQRSGQTVGGTAAGYSNRYFFDDVIDDYYKIPERIKAVSRNRIIKITKEIFAENIWGMGILGNVDQEFIDTLEEKLKPLWK